MFRRQPGLANRPVGFLGDWLPGSGTLALIALLSVPVGLLAVRPNWLYGDSGRDPWIYFGYFQYAPRYASEFAHRYYSTRLSLILPGYWLSGLAPDRAHLILHLGLAWLAIGSLFLLARSLFGVRTAIASALLLACHPYALRALGHSYPDGFAIAYLLAAMLAIRLSSRARWRFVWLGLAGVFTWALVTLNLYYALFLPGLAAQLAIELRPLAPDVRGRAALAALLGGVLCFFVFCTINAAWGGPFFYLSPSFQWVARRVSGDQPNIWTDASRAWLSIGTWLALPTAAAAAVAAAVGRSRAGIGRGAAGAHAAVFQASFVLVATVFTALQFSGWSSPLEHRHYASVLIPVAILSLAGLVAPGLRQLDRSTWLAVLAGLAAMLTVPFLVLPDAPSVGAHSRLTPLGWGLLAGAPIVLGALLRGSRARSLLILLGVGLIQIAILATSQTLARFRGVELHQQRAAFRQLTELVHALGPEMGDPRTRLWYDRSEPVGWFYDSAASVFLLCPRMINLHFPDAAGGMMCDGRPLTPGTRIALLSSAPDAPKRAAESLARLGLALREIDYRSVAGPVPGVAFRIFDTALLPTTSG